MADNTNTLPHAQLQSAIFGYLRKGMTHETIEHMHNLSKGQIKAWMGLSNDFNKCVRLAEAEPELKCLKIIFAAMEKNPAMAKWFLETRYPNKYGDLDVETLKLEKEKLRAEIDRLVMETKKGLVGNTQINITVPDYAEVEAVVETPPQLQAKELKDNN
jgi:hypothetical protein